MDIEGRKLNGNVLMHFIKMAKGTPKMKINK